MANETLNDTRSAELRQAHEVMAVEAFRSRRDAYLEAFKGRQTADSAPPVTGAEHRYTAVVTYNGGHFIADIEVAVFRDGKYLGRFSYTTAPTFGKLKATATGTLVLAYPIGDIRNWRYTVTTITSGGMMTASFIGLGFEYIGFMVAGPFDLIDLLSVGSGFVE